ncbi:MAG: TerC family protein [Aeromonas sp.]
MLEWMADPNAWIALATLTLLEIVLGIDNIIFISVLVGRLPKAEQQRARLIGLSLAMLTRILLLLSLAWVMRLTAPLFSLFGEAISGRDLILLFGGLFLIGKSSHEIHAAFNDHAATPSLTARSVSVLSVLVQIAILDLVFSLDSVITAVGMADHVPVMVLAIIIAVLVMMLAAKTIGDFVEAHPTIKMLALSFLTLVGFTLLAEGLDLHIPKGYVYFAMAFSLGVELINLRLGARANASR